MGIEKANMRKQALRMRRFTFFQKHQKPFAWPQARWLHVAS
ncbi:hypothetical protein B4098_1709 [Heyndrickxia coagulans]|uniref:Uncharacterized protein n=1 Tax=Heyndrickxia coagulans TaxID=1398 RepID=A0A150K108_HEYCO|nr:hypothetical protein B4098_1709 [Heyndrickxia coagulans]